MSYSIYKRPRSPWLWCKVSLPDREPVRKSTKTADPAEADAFARRLEANLKAGFEVAGRAFTVGKALERIWKEHYSDSKDQRTAKLILDELERRLGAATSLEAIQEPRILALVEDLKKAGNTNATVNRKLVKLRFTLKQACAVWKVIDRVPYVPAQREPADKRHRVYSLVEEAEVLSRLYRRGGEHAALAELVEVLADTGMRTGEALPLEPGEVNLERRMIQLWETKNSRARGIPMTDRVFGILEQRMGRDRVFHELRDYDHARRLWDEVRAELGMMEDRTWVLHSWRHTAGTRILEATGDVRLAQQFLGHENVSTTQRYAIHTNQRLAEAVTQLQAHTLRPVNPTGRCAPSVPECAQGRGVLASVHYTIGGPLVAGPDSKSAGGNTMRVRLSPSAPQLTAPSKNESADEDA